MQPQPQLQTPFWVDPFNFDWFLDGDKFVFLDVCVKNWFCARLQDCISNKVIKTTSSTL